MRLFLPLLSALFVLMSCGRPAPVSVAPAQPNYSAKAASLVTYPKFGDADPHPWKGRGPRSFPVHGIDVSRWQGDIDWSTAKASGVNFVFIKATEGGDLADPMFDNHRSGARAAGVPWGAYHYYYFCRPADEQARWFIRNVPKGADLPHVLDMEWNHRSRTCPLRPDGATVRAEAARFLDILEAHYDRRPVVYTTVDFYRDTDIGRLRRTEFWLRSVAGHPRQVYPGAFWTFWQYTGTGLVPGVNGKVDINVFRSGAEVWLRWAAGEIG